MPTVATKESLGRLREVVQPVTGARADYDSLLQAIGNAKYVLLERWRS
jgi:hypothetical protein